MNEVKEIGWQGKARGELDGERLTTRPPDDDFVIYKNR